MPLEEHPGAAGPRAVRPRHADRGARAHEVPRHLVFSGFGPGRDAQLSDQQLRKLHHCGEHGIPGRRRAAVLLRGRREEQLRCTHLPHRFSPYGKRVLHRQHARASAVRRGARP